MRKLTYAAITGFILFALSFVFITGMVTATNGIATFYGSPKEIFPQPYYELLISLAIGFIPLADVIWQHTKDKEFESDKEETKALFSNLTDVLKALKEDKKGMARLPGGRYDPDPGRRRKRHRGPRKGIEPPGLKRWRLAHRRTHDPGYRRSLWRGPRGGHYFKGPRKRRYDPARFARARGYARRAGSKVGGFFSRWGSLVGFLGALAYGVWTSYSSVADWFTKGGYGEGKPDPVGNTSAAGRYWWLLSNEYRHLYETVGDYSPLGDATHKSYLHYKFMESAWSKPFWISLIAFLGTTIAKMTGKLGKYSSILTPINKISKGVLAVSTIGALVLPGTPPGYPNNQLPPPPPNQGGTPMRVLEYTYGQKS
jgi:hypothetical protein